MPSRSHGGSEPQRVLTQTRRDQVGILRRFQQKIADNRWAIYLRPAGLGRHYVRNFDNTRPYLVGSAVQRLTFMPGTQVLLASHTSEPGEIIIGSPSVDRKGSTVNPPNLPKAGLVAPAPVTRDYLGLDLTASSFSAYLYKNGTRDSTIAIQGTTGLNASSQLQGAAIMSLDPLRIGMTWEYDAASEMKIVVWDTVSNTINTIDRWGVRAAGFDFYGGMSAYDGLYHWIEGDFSGTPDEWYLMRTSDGATASEVGGGTIATPSGAVPYPSVPVFNGSSAAIVYGDDCGSTDQPGVVVINNGISYVVNPSWAEVPNTSCPRDGWAQAVGGLVQSVSGKSAGLYTFDALSAGGSVSMVYASGAKGVPLLRHESGIFASASSFTSAVPSRSGADMVLKRDSEYVRLPISPVADPSALSWTTISPSVALFAALD